MVQKLGSPTLSRLGVSRDVEIENKATITGLGLVAEMNLVESRTGGRYMLQVDSDWRDGGGYVVYGCSDVDGGKWQR